MRHHGHGQGHAACLVGLDLLLLGLVQRGQGDQAHQVPAHADSALHPALVVQVLVGVAIRAVVKADAWQHAEQLFACLVGSDALLEVLFAQFRALQQGEFFKLAHIGRRWRQRSLAGIGHREISAWRNIHQCRQFTFCVFQILTALVDQRGCIEQRTLIVECQNGRNDTLRFSLARTGQRQIGAFEHILGLRRQALSAQRAPVGSAHILKKILNHLAATLFGNQELI